jgi:TonB family protein
MRKTTFVRMLCRPIGLLWLFAVGMIGLPAFAQDATSVQAPGTAPAAAPAKDAPAAMPSDPKELMLLAAKSNGLTGDDVKPWHVKATYQLLDDAGNVKDQGTYEEFWVSPTKYKRTFTGKAFTRTEYGTKNGALVSGDQDPLYSQGHEIRDGFFAPMPSLESIDKNTYVIEQREAGGVKYTCLNLKDALGKPYGSTWCLAPDMPILRVGLWSPDWQVVHNRILRFQGRFVAGDLAFIQQGKANLTAHIDTIESLGSVDEAIFLPPADAAPPKPMRITISGGAARSGLIKSIVPDYPPLAKARGISGTVVLQAIIDKNGHIRDLHVISGPDQLQQAALDAVKQWVYRPYLLDGEPVEVRTQVDVVFTLGNPRDRDD